LRIVVCLHAAPPGGAPLTGNDLEALRMARGLGAGHEVVALLAGTKEETAPLEAALAAGVDRAARVSGESFAAADFHTLGQVLGSAASSLGANLILSGARSDTEGLGALTASVARHMSLPHLANIESLELLDQPPLALAAPLALAVTVRGSGRKRRIGVRLPFVMSVTRSGPTPVVGSPPPPAAPAPPGKEARTIETLAVFDPEVTVIRRRTEMLGSSAKAEREVQTVASAAELVAALMARAR
jgi:electron transfer flavoprotein alpha/beta subunit